MKFNFAKLGTTLLYMTSRYYAKTAQRKKNPGGYIQGLCKHAFPDIQNLDALN